MDCDVKKTLSNRRFTKHNSTNRRTLKNKRFTANQIYRMSR